MIAKSALL